MQRELRRAAAERTPAAALAELCRVAAGLLSVSATSVALRTAAHPGGGFVNSGALAEAMTELEFVLGQGPGVDAYDGRRPVLVSDLDQGAARWPQFAPAALEAGVRAVFAFPLQVGAIRFGSVCLFRDEPGELERDGGVRAALALADALLAVLLQLAPDAAGDGQGDGIGALAGHRAAVHQATGMIAAQLGVRVDEALLRLRALAFAEGRPVDEVARRVVDKKLRFNERMS